MENTTVANEISTGPMSEIAAYHRQMEAKYMNSIVPDSPAVADMQALMAFNGFYALNTAAGAFFAIDTNMLMQSGFANPVYDLSLLISLDGKTSARVPFTGTFDGTNLVQPGTADAAEIDLTLTRTDGSDGTTATCSGTITLPRKKAVTISGTTYNNPIPASLFTGSYYATKADGTTVKVMSIGADNEVQYDNGLNNGTLYTVPSYVYNMNMYFFSFPQDGKTVSLVMGTAGVQGFACNNMVVDKSVTPNTITTRSLLTIPGASMEPFEWYDISGNQLAGYSGYYQIPSVSPLAFISIQAQYATISDALSLDLYLVMISISLDGVTSKGYYFDPLTMTFEDNTLKMPGQIKLTFDRTYNATTGSLVNITGSIGTTDITGSTLFNPVPLSAFGGVPMTNAQEDTLTVTNDNQVTYNGTLMDSIVYVPLMYILAYPITNSSTVMSFGTNGLKGNACIVTTNIPTAPTVCFVDAIPDAVNG